MITLTEKKSGFLNLLASRQVRHGILVAPLLLLFILFFVIPVGLMFLSSLNTPAVGTETLLRANSQKLHKILLAPVT